MKRLHPVVSWLAFALAILVPPSRLAADDYQGAEAVLTQISSAQSANAHLSPARQWLADMEAFRKKSGTMPPEVAARRWLDLASHYFALNQAALSGLSAADQARMNADLQSQDLRDPLLKSLPGPASWPGLARLIDAQPAPPKPRGALIDAAFKLLGHTLIADPPGQRKALLALLAAKGGPDFAFAPSLDIPALEDALIEESDDPAKIAGNLRERIAIAKKAGGNTGFGYEQAFRVPDLVTLMGGGKQAEPLLAEVLTLPRLDLNIDGAETRQLAAKLALEQVAALKSPPWGLACSLDAAPLFEALQARFPSAHDGRYSEAYGYYFLHLIASGQGDKALAIADSISSESAINLPVDDMEKAGYTQQVHDFLDGLLAKHPEVPLWDEYIALAAKTGQTARTLDLMRGIDARADLTPIQRKNVRTHFYLALLAADHIDEGVAELKKLIATADQAQSIGLLARAAQWLGGDDAENSALEKNVVLARIGQLLDRKDLLDEGIAGAEHHAATDPPGGSGAATTITSLAELLTQVGRGPEAEKLLAQTIASDAASPERSSSREDYLAALVRVYYHAGRPADVLAVLQDYPGWGIADLKDGLSEDTEGFTIAEYSTHAASDNLLVAYMAAWALAEQGQKDQALRILNALLDQDETFDPAYELLLKLSGQAAIPRLDQLAARDRFETRPLIWKAQLQLDAGKLDDAEKTARSAIAIDPSDGQQGPGRRMRAYSVLAAILEKKGDKEHAQLYRGAVAAIRISEHADRFYEAGLLTRAVQMYEEALTHFADAYCIQSRLALRLSELGDNAGAEEHYRRAYELMPESFGRVESHCFGCERAFEGARAQGIAEKVFTQLAAKMPARPQVHYLLGYLRYEEGRYRESLPEFQQAVKLDPDYLNAWKKIGELNQEMYLPTQLRNDIALNEVRLDPLQRHGDPDVAGATDLAGVWNAAAAAKDDDPVPSGPLFPLPASAEEMHGDRDQPARFEISWNNHRRREPSEVIAGNSFITAISEVFSSAAMLEMQP